MRTKQSAGKNSGAKPWVLGCIISIVFWSTLEISSSSANTFADPQKTMYLLLGIICTALAFGVLIKRALR